MPQFFFSMTHQRPHAGRWVRSGNSVVLLDMIGTATDAANTEWKALQLAGPFNEFEVPPPPGVAILGTTHRLDCPAGCAPIPAAQCIPILRQAISEAIKMALGAA